MVFGFQQVFLNEVHQPCNKSNGERHRTEQGEGDVHPDVLKDRRERLNLFRKSGGRDQRDEGQRQDKGS